MGIDPDLLAIRRRRRQAGRCVRCGATAGRAALCKACGADWRYCPKCENVYGLAAVRSRSAVEGRTTAYCTPCSRLIRRHSIRSWDERTAAAERRRRELLKKVIPLYKKGMTFREIAARLGMTTGSLSGWIGYARRRGEWPAGLTRKRTTGASDAR
jgi:hypothetical protein